MECGHSRSQGGYSLGEYSQKIGCFLGGKKDDIMTLPWHWHLMTTGLSTSLGVVKDVGLGWEVLNEHA